MKLQEHGKGRTSSMFRHNDKIARTLGAQLRRICAGGLLLAAASTAQATPLIEASSALQAGDPQTALTLASTVHAEHPQHVDALLLKARAQSALGRPREARASAVAAYRAADVAPAQYASALILAELAARERNFTLSQYWLRRAVQHTSSDAEVTQLAKAYQVAKRENPWRFQLSAGLAPNTNINNGSSEKIIMIQGLPFVLSPTARALSGITAEAQTAVTYRFSQTETSQSLIGLQAAGRWNWLDRKSQAAAPSTSGRNFDYYAAYVTAQHMQMLGQSQLDLSAKAGRSWYGGAVFTDVLGANAALTLPLGASRDTLTLGLDAQHVWHRTASLSDETIGAVDLTYGHTFAWGDTLRIGAGYTQNISANAIQEYKLPRTSVEYDFAKPIAGILLSFGASYGYKDFAQSPYSVTGRQDHIVSGEISAEFRNLSWMGFAPKMTVQANRAWSNVSLYSQQSMSAGLGLQSRF